MPSGNCNMNIKISGVKKALPGKISSCACLGLLSFLSLSAGATTYYVDYSSGSDANNGLSTNTPWREAPGMNGFSGTYTHLAGDQFIFRGGVTWSNDMAPWTISNSGVPGTNDYYGVDKAWFSGASWTSPVFDGGSQNPVASGEWLGYWLLSGSYVTLDGLTLQNIGVPGVNQGNYAIKLTGHDLTVQNMALHVESRIALMLSAAAGGAVGNYTLCSNDISECSWGIGGGPEAGTVMTNVLIHDNVLHDFHDQMVIGVHGDGVYIYSHTTNLNTYCDNLRIYNNFTYGDFSKSDSSTAAMSAFFWASAQMQGSAYIYNNVMTYTQNGASIGFAIGGNGSAVACAGSLGSVYVFNNSYYADAHSYYFVDAGGLSNLVVMNNIFVGGSAAYSLTQYINNFASDYNDFYGWKGGIAFNLTYQQFKSSGPIAAISVNNPGSNYTVGSIITAAYGLGALATVTSTNAAGGATGLNLMTGGFGYVANWPGMTALKAGSGGGLTVGSTVPTPSGFEMHGSTNNPLFVSASDLHLQPGSPAIGAGTNLSYLFVTDKDGNPRSAGGNWDVGAYVGQTAPAPIAPPTNLRLQQ
jgi:hypothetical protein